jgi:uncharacterized phage protein gp47/JayE
MAWTRPTIKQIYDRISTDITSRLTGNAPLLRFSLLNIMAWVWAGACHLVYGAIAWLAKQIIPGPSNDPDFLARHAIMWLNRSYIAAVPASGNFTFTGTNGVNVPSGTRIVSDAGLEYVTSAGGNISSGSVTLAATCTTAGAAGNLPVSSVLSLSSPISGVNNAVTNPAEISTGADQETPTALLTKILFRIQHPPAGGSKDDYIAWAMDASVNVKNAWCFPNYTGLGTVQVVIIRTGSDPVAPGDLITVVQNYITVGPPTRAPVTAVVTTSTVVARLYDFTIAVRPNDPTVTAKITTALETLFANEASPKGNDTGTIGVRPGTILLSHIRDAISDVVGLEDFEITAITRDGVGQAIDDLNLTGLDYHVLDDITYTTLT